MNKKHKWLFNFSSSTVGGGLIRILETIKWFDSNNGSYFIVNYRIKDLVSKYNKTINIFLSLIINSNDYYQMDIIFLE